MINLSKRLTMIAELVTKGNILCDVGCDHGYTSIYAVQKGISPRALAMDLRKGPLAIAQANVTEHGLNERIDLRLSDGLEKLAPGEADTILISGMGGPLICEILKRYPEKTASAKELVLSPQSELAEFEACMRDMGLVLSDIHICEDEGKYYFGYRYTHVKSDATVGDAITPYPIETYIKYLEHEKEEKTKILNGLEKTTQQSEKQAARIVGLKDEIRRIQYEIDGLQRGKGV